MSDLESLRNARARLSDGEPIRILIGHAMHSTMEIMLVPNFMGRLRATLLRDIDQRIADLTPPDPEPATAALPISDERTS
ncbi:hypothetical protein [Mesorhizobium captivum]|uniref:hypothetical protein n=1 Tax=Mesorhizobium captivum TaxID=3072319 RepID=UPI002A23F3BE|nr:hypothetical protein [Mesorhizobium sp. VK23E]MDX8513577.1 hypothetical protein [Mesorhizobium sp. VK23E]